MSTFKYCAWHLKNIHGIKQYVCIIKKNIYTIPKMFDRSTNTYAMADEPVATSKQQQQHDHRPPKDTLNRGPDVGHLQLQKS